jgi:hypothetical protein
MLFLNEDYISLNKLTNESVASDKFEAKCVRYLKKNYPNHSFVLKGGNNSTESDILVDNKFYIECKMTENGKKKDGAQSSGFSLSLNSEGTRFEYSKKDKSGLTNSAKQIVKYINKNFDSFKDLVNRNSKTKDIDLDKRVFSNYINEYYKEKNVKYFMSLHEGKIILFKNTPSMIEKYFDICATVRYLSDGTRYLPKKIRDSVIKFLKSKYKIKNVDFNDLNTIISTDEPILEPYVDYEDCSLYISNYRMPDNEYKVMKLTGNGAPRVIFNLTTKRDQDIRDVESFEKYINKK